MKTQRVWLAVMLVGALAIVGCRTREGTLVEVSVGATTILEDVARLAVKATIGTDVRTFDIPLGEKSIPPIHVFAIEVPGNRTGSITVDVDARSSADVSVGKKGGAVALVPGGVVSLSLVIGSPDVDMGGDAGADGGGGDGGGGADLSTGPVITPSAPTLGAGRYVQLSADTAVTWAVVGGDANGTISATGIYNAPFVPGTYTVTATGASGTSQVMIVVKPLVVSRVAGRIGGFGNADGVGSGAHFGEATDVAVARDSYQLYVTDKLNHTIRQVDPSTGAVNVIAGLSGSPGSVEGTGSSARFNAPRSICQAALNVLYIWESGSGALRSLDASTGAVTTLVAGTDLAGHTLGKMLCKSGTDLVYFLDGAVLKKLVPSTKAVTSVLTLPETGTAFDYDGNDIVLTTPHGVYSANLGDAPPSAVLVAGSTVEDDIDNASGGMARFRYLSGVVINGADWLVADGQSCKLKRVSRTNPFGVTTLVGNADSCIGEQNGDSIDGTGSAARFVWAINAMVQRNSSNPIFYVVERGLSVREINLTTLAAPIVRTVAGGTFLFGLTQGAVDTALLNYPWALVAVGDALFVGEGGWKEFATNVMRRIDLGGGTIEIAAGKAGIGTSEDGTGTDATLAFAHGLAYDGSDKLYIADASTIRTYSIASHAVTTIAGAKGAKGYVDLTGSAARFGTTWEIGFAGSSAYVIDIDYPGSLREVTAAGLSSTLAGSSTETGYVNGNGASARFDFAIDQQTAGAVASDNAGNLYVTDSANHVVRKVILATKEVSLFAGNPTTPTTIDGIGDAAGFERPTSIAFDGNRTLYVGDKWCVRAVDIETAKVVTVLGRKDRQGISLGAAPATLNTVSAITRHVSGDLFLIVGEPYSDNTILRVSAP